MNRWILKRNKADLNKMASALDITTTTACVMANRGISSYQEAIDFLDCPLDKLRTVSSMKDMEKACAIIIEKIKAKKKITVYGDYDVDGVSSTAILYQALRYLGAEVSYYIPHRQFEGYGLHIEAVQKLWESGTDTIFTCDNGISALEEIKMAKSLGMTVLVLDHHEPPYVEENGEQVLLASVADAIIDPKQKDCAYPFKMLCAGGLAYKFALHLFDILKVKSTIEEELLCFATLATVCDIVDLLGENRILVKNGLQAINRTKLIGLRALIEKACLADKKLTEYHIGFIIGPCINATGRLESAHMALELLLTQEKARAEDLAQQLVELNAHRKEVTLEGTQIAINLIEESTWKEDPIFVLYHPLIQESVAGIIAGRIKERYYRPTIMLTGEGEVVKGSARSVEGYNIFEALFQNATLFHSFGGHAMAAGMSLDKNNIDLLRKHLNEQCRLCLEDRMPILKIEQRLPIEEVSLSLIRDLEYLSPFGKENPQPLFGDKQVIVERVQVIGKDKNILRFAFYSHNLGERVQAIDFNGYNRFVEMINDLYDEEKCGKILKGETIHLCADIIYHPVINSYNAKESVQLVIDDIRQAQKE